MKSHDGKIVFKKDESGKLAVFVDIGGGHILPTSKKYAPRMELKNADCKAVEKEGVIIRVLVNGKEPPLQEGDEFRPETEFEYVDIFNLQSAKVPEFIKEQRLSDIDNFHLKFHKYARYYDNDQKFKFFDGSKDTKPKQIKPVFDTQQLQAILQRHQSAVNNRGLYLQEKTFIPDWRLIVGLGQESVYETSLTLHHIYGLPYIPASAIKGVLRSWLINECYASEEDRALQHKGFCDIFGCSKESVYKKACRGKVTFFDALPTREPMIHADIMNNHYQEYYSDTTHRKPPGDYYNPNPVYFLTVVNTPFWFGVGCSPQYQDRELQLKIGDKTLYQGQFLTVVMKALTDALGNAGLGAKTAVGYGTMNDLNE